MIFWGGSSVNCQNVKGHDEGKGIRVEMAQIGS